MAHLGLYLHSKVSNLLPISRQKSLYSHLSLSQISLTSPVRVHWGAPFQPPFSDPRSTLTHSLCQPPCPLRLGDPFSDSRSALYSHSIYSLNINVNILRPAHAQSSRLPHASPRPYLPTWGAPFQLPFSDPQWGTVSDRENLRHAPSALGSRHTSVRHKAL